MNKKRLILSILSGVVLTILLSVLLIFMLNTDYPILRNVNDAMKHDSLIEKNHYLFLEEKYGYTQEEVDSWPLKSGFSKGDVLVVAGVEENNLKIGDVIVYNIEGQKVPIAHRIVEMDGKIVTKGDHNPVENLWVPSKIHGKVIYVIPKLGYLYMVPFMNVIIFSVISWFILGFILKK